MDNIERGKQILKSLTRQPDIVGLAKSHDKARYNEIYSPQQRSIKRYNDKIKTTFRYRNYKACTKDPDFRNYSELSPLCELDNPTFLRLRAILKTALKMPYAQRVRHVEEHQLAMATPAYFYVFRTSRNMLTRKTPYTTCAHAVKYKQLMDLQPFMSIKMQNLLADEFAEAEHKMFITRQLELNAIDTDYLETWLINLDIHMDSSLVFLEIVMLWSYISEYIPTFYNTYNLFVNEPQGRGTLQTSIVDGFTKLFNLFELYTEYLVKEAGASPEPAVKYFEQLAKQAVIELEELETMVDDPNDLSEEDMQEMRKFNEIKTEMLPAFLKQKAQFFREIISEVETKKKHLVNYFGKSPFNYKQNKDNNLLTKLDEDVKELNGHCWVQGKCAQKIFDYLKLKPGLSKPLSKAQVDLPPSDDEFTEN